MIKQSIARILAVELDRKDFLKALGIGVVAASGVAAAVNSVVKQTSTTGTAGKSAFTYGEAAYGGKTISR